MVAICALAPAPSVTLTAVARPFNGVALATKSAGSVETCGVTSAVTMKSPPARRLCRALWLIVGTPQNSIDNYSRIAAREIGFMESKFVDPVNRQRQQRVDAAIVEDDALLANSGDGPDTSTMS